MKLYSTYFIDEEYDINDRLGVFSTYEQALECAKKHLDERGFDEEVYETFLEYDYTIESSDFTNIKVEFNIQVDTGELENRGLTHDDLINDITIRESEVIDGFEITRRGELGDILTEFFLMKANDFKVDIQS